MPAAALTLFETFLRLCRLKMAPQDLPASLLLQRLSVVSYGTVSLVSGLFSLSLQRAMLGAVLDVVLLMGFTAVALKLRHHANRYTQTVTALAGAGTVIGLLALPVMAALSFGQPAGPLHLLLSNLWLLMLLWNMLVIGHIARHALSLTLPGGLGVAFLYFLTMLGAYALLPESLVA